MPSIDWKFFAFPLESSSVLTEISVDLSKSLKVTSWSLPELIVQIFAVQLNCWDFYQIKNKYLASAFSEKQIDSRSLRQFTRIVPDFCCDWRSNIPTNILLLPIFLFLQQIRHEDECRLHDLFGAIKRRHCLYFMRSCFSQKLPRKLD